MATNKCSRSWWWDTASSTRNTVCACSFVATQAHRSATVQVSPRVCDVFQWDLRVSIPLLRAHEDWWVSWPFVAIALQEKAELATARRLRRGCAHADARKGRVDD